MVEGKTGKTSVGSFIIITSRESKKVDAYKSRTTFFLRYREMPNFEIVEGICETALIIDSYYWYPCQSE